MAYGTVNADVIGTSVAGSNLGAGNASIMKNRIINGAMMINQRAFSGSMTTAGISLYTLDRWQGIFAVNDKFTVSQNAGSVTPPSGFINYLGITSSTAYTSGSTDYFGMNQKVEGLNISDLDWGTATAKSVTLSFWVRSSLTGAFGGSITNSNQTYSYPFSYTINSANTWQQITITIAGPTSGTWLTTNGVGLILTFNLGYGSTYAGTAGTWASAAYYTATGTQNLLATNGATLYITGVQLEVGSSATGFEYVNYQTSLANCQRYYYKILGTSSGNTLALAFARNSTTAQSYATFQVPMRIAPTALETSGTATDYQIVYLTTSATCNSVPTFDKGTVFGSDIYFVVASGLTAGQCVKSAANSNSGYLAWSAEL